ncbi:MAG: phenylalanine--tRNA ligase subunit beta [Nitrospirae bacterium]|nr:MAG: phenylalanine--tRNA ligase subunit beta [Nitrospirota bacterium]
MPTISIYHHDLEHLLGRSIALHELEAWLPLVKGEIKDHVPATGELRIELQDSNRPDLWCVEGIARQIRAALQQQPVTYSFFSQKPRIRRRIRVMPGLETVRPFVVACCARGYTITEDSLTQLIQAQEKLADLYGHKRWTVSIGLYRLAAIRFPVTYGLVKPDEVRFVPLGFTEKLTLGEILSIHPKGQEYGEILAGHTSLPLLWDQEGQVLSFPPIINSQDLGEVKPGDTELMVEVTGTDLRMVLLTLNIFAVNLADRGATIEPIDIVYPWTTEWGRTLRTPFTINQIQRISVHAIEAALGVPLGAEAIQQALAAYGYDVKASRHTLAVRLPPYRQDVMHQVDVAEDVAISRGYNSFTPLMPAQFTVGGLSSVERLSDHVRDLMIGAGFQEIFSNILMSREDLLSRMNLPDTPETAVLEIENVMSHNYSCLRSWIIPSLLRVESASSRSFYPHRLFEVGEVAIPDSTQENGSLTLTKLGALVAHPAANFSEVHTTLDMLLYYLLTPYILEPIPHPSFLEGRAGRIIWNTCQIGLIGELHPAVLEAWHVEKPVAVFELNLDTLCQRWAQEGLGVIP